jgi:hypothetical protein
MSRAFLFLCPALVSLSFTSAGCNSGGNDASSSSASAIKVERTCKDAVGRYGEQLGKSLMKDAANPVPAAKHEQAVAAIKAAAIKSCEEDKWDELPIDCLAGLFEKPGFLPPDKMEDAYTVCANAAGKEKSAKMDERVARAMVDIVKGGSGAGSAAPAAATAWASKDGGFQIDFNGKAPEESKKDDPNGGTWHEASLPSGKMAQWTDYASAAVAAAEVKVFLPTREKDQIKRDEVITHQGLKGRDIEMTLPSGKVLWIRFLIDGKRVFKLGAVVNGDNTEAKAFIESFKRVGAEAAAAPSAAPAASAPGAPGPANPASPPAKPAAPKPPPRENDGL